MWSKAEIKTQNVVNNKMDKKLIGKKTQMVSGMEKESLIMEQKYNNFKYYECNVPSKAS